MGKEQITVLIVDDSALIRQMLTSMLESDPDIKVVGAAPDPLTAREMIKQLNPDVLTLDIEMPKMDGIAFLEKIMTLRPMPVVMISSLTQEGADVALQALEIGAVDYIGKPTSDLRAGLEKKASEIVSKVKTAAKARVMPRTATPTAKKQITFGNYKSTEQVILIGSSTGGVEALREIICVLPPNSPAVMITQHMPATFTTSFANRMNDISKVTVCEAAPNQRVLPGHVYIAPGGRHLELARSGANYICKIHDDPPVNGHCPSVDILFNSGAKVAAANAVGVILTGMGRDGAQGLLALREAGARTIGQDKSTCVVYGMPRAAFEIGAVEKQYPLTQIAGGIFNCLDKHDTKAIRI